MSGGSGSAVPPNFFEQLFASNGSSSNNESGSDWSPIAVRGYTPPVAAATTAPLGGNAAVVNSGGQVGSDGGHAGDSGYSPAGANGGTPDFADSTGSIGGEGGSAGGGK